jgi:menaquinone-dependent protoporphyrinogen oxidase
MDLKTGMIYSTVDGQTLKICKVLKEAMAHNGQEVDLCSIDDFDGDLSRYDRIIIGASIRYGLHNKKIIDFINANKEELDSIRTAFFSVNLVARKPEKSAPDTNPYVIKFFKSIDWKPDVVEVFAGMLDYQKYPFFDRIMIQLIMWMTKGPTNSDAKIEYTDWEKVREFGIRLSTL